MNEFISGLIAGFGSTIIGHPLDTIKVRIQIDNCTFRQSFVQNLFSGLRYPLYTISLQNGIIFSSYNICYNNLQKNNINYGYGNNFISGAVAGINNSFICSPIELVKIKLQKSNSNYKSSWDCAKTMIKNKCLFRGLQQTILRDSISYGAYFTTYNISQDFLKTKYNNKYDSYFPLISGGLSGIMCWVSSYPIDTLKTIYQSDNKLSLIQTHHQIIKNKGYIGYWKGLFPCLTRAFIANGCTFYLYELFINFL